MRPLSPALQGGWPDAALAGRSGAVCDPGSVRGGGAGGGAGRLRPARAALRARLPALVVPVPADQPAHRPLRRVAGRPAPLPARGVRRDPRGVAAGPADDGAGLGHRLVRGRRGGGGGRRDRPGLRRARRGRHRRVHRAGGQRGAAGLRPQLPDAVRGPDPQRDRPQVRRGGDRGRRDLLLRRRELAAPGGPGRPVRARPHPPVRPAVDPARRRRAGVRRPRRDLADAVRRGQPQAAGGTHGRPAAAAGADPGRGAGDGARQVAAWRLGGGRWRVTAFALTSEQQDLAERVRQIASGQLRALAGAGTHGHVTRELIKEMGDLGLLARLFPGQGGQGGLGGGEPPKRGVTGGSPPGGKQSTAMDLCLLREALATQSTEAETALALQGLGSYPVLQSGREEVVRRWLPAVAAGDAVAAFALTEPEAGSDAAALTLRAEPDGPGWRLTGEKIWISNAPEADFYTVFARTTPGAGARGVSAFVVPADRPGLSGEHLDMISPHPIGRLVFDGVPVQPAELLGETDRGFRVAMRTLDLFRPSVGAFAVGMAQAATDAAVAHAGTRTAFGGPLKDQQAVSHLLAEMATRTEAARLLAYAAAAPYDDSAAAATGGGKGLAAKSAMAKLFATETAQFVVDAAVQLHGARALRRGHLLEHLYREVRAPRIYEGASEVQRTIIA